jgi:fatty acid-binding protein DegV
MHTFFVLEDLSVFQKSGRLSHLQAIITNTLRIRLIMGGTADGTICKLGQALSMESALKKMTGLIQEKCKTANISGKTLVITHCNCPERAEFVKKLILQQCRFLKSVICRAGGISTIYANDGGIIVSF